MRKHGGASVRWSALAALVVVWVVSHGGTAGGHVQATGKDGLSGYLDVAEMAQRSADAYLAQSKGRSKSGFDSIPPEERPRMQKKFREWQSLPPDQKDAMRRRLDEWNRMPPSQRDRYEQRYQQWQQLSPDERRQLENNLQRWENLSPQDRDAIRKRFRK